VQLPLAIKITPDARSSFLQNLDYQTLLPNTAATETGQGMPAGDKVMHDYSPAKRQPETDISARRNCFASLWVSAEG